MPRILIAGCGYVGTAAADLFHEAGWMVEGWTRSAGSVTQLLNKPYPVVAVDIARREEVNARPENFDAVVHCASSGGGDLEAYRDVYLNGARNLLDRFLGSGFLFTSSSSVYGQRTGEWVTEESPATPIHERGRLLREAEDLVLSRGGVVARLAGIHGPGRSALLKKFLAGEAVLDLEHDRYANYIHREDAATAIRQLVDPRSLPGQIYNVSDDAPMLRSDCYRWLAARLDRPVPPTARENAVSKRGQGNKRVSNRRLCGLGWRPQYRSFPEAMEKSILPSFGL